MNVSYLFNYSIIIIKVILDKKTFRNFVKLSCASKRDQTELGDKSKQKIHYILCSSFAVIYNM